MSQFSDTVTIEGVPNSDFLSLRQKSEYGECSVFPRAKKQKLYFLKVKNDNQNVGKESESEDESDSQDEEEEDNDTNKVSATIRLVHLSNIDKFSKLHKLRDVSMMIHPLHSLNLGFLIKNFGEIIYMIN